MKDKNKFQHTPPHYTFVQDLLEEIELGWDGPKSSMTMDEIIEFRKNRNRNLKFSRTARNNAK